MSLDTALLFTSQHIGFAMDVTKKKLRQRAAEILKYDIWTCKVCEIKLDIKTNVATIDEKSKFLQQHIRTNHKDSPAVDPDMDDEFLALYFLPANYEIQKNKKLL